MNARTTEITTPNSRTVPPSAVKNVEESRQQRLQRAQSRFRDRGGIFVPTTRNTLIDILLGKKDLSPKKSRRSRSRSVSPHKPFASPTKGKAKRVSLSSSSALAAGHITVPQPELRRSPRKKSAPAASKPSVSRKRKDQKSAAKHRDHESGDEAHAVTTKPKSARPKHKQSDEEAFEEEQPVKKKRKGAKDGTTQKTRKGKESVQPKTTSNDIEQTDASTSQPLLHDCQSDVGTAPRSNSRSKKTAVKTTSKSVKKPDTLADSDDDDVPLAALKSRPRTIKRKLSIVQEEEEDVAGPTAKAANATGLPSHLLSIPPTAPSRKKTKVISQLESASPPPVKASLKAVAPKPNKDTAATVNKKAATQSDYDSDAEPPLPKTTQKRGREQSSSVGKVGKGKASKLVKANFEDRERDAPPRASFNAKDRSQVEDDAVYNPSKTEPVLPDVDESPPLKARAKGKGKLTVDISAAGETSETKSKSRGKGNAGAPKTRAAFPSEDDEEGLPALAMSKRKRPTAPALEEDDLPTPPKRVKTLPLRDVDEQSPPSKRKADRGKTRSRAKANTRGESHKAKENTPNSECSDAPPVKYTRSRSKPSSKITRPRKSVMIRMKQPLPPVEDNDPDPIDFLS